MRFRCVSVTWRLFPFFAKEKLMYWIFTWTRKPNRSQVSTLKNWLARHYSNVSMEEAEGPAAPTATRYFGWIAGPEEYSRICFIEDVRAIRKKACEVLRV